MGSVSRASFLILLIALPCGCASRRSTLEIYQRIQAVRLYGYACNRLERIDPDARLQRLRPWLEAALGRTELEAMDQGFGADDGNLDLTACPDAEDLRQSRLDYLGLLRELERRSRRSETLRPQ